MLPPKNFFTDEEIDVIAAFADLDPEKVRGIGYLARLKLDSSVAAFWWDASEGMPQALERFQAEQAGAGVDRD